MTRNGDDGSPGRRSGLFVGPPAGPRLQALNRSELFHIARGMGIIGTMVMTRDELLTAIRETQDNTDSSPAERGSAQGPALRGEAGSPKMNSGSPAAGETGTRTRTNRTRSRTRPKPGSPTRPEQSRPVAPPTSAPGAPRSIESTPGSRALGPPNFNAQETRRHVLDGTCLPRPALGSPKRRPWAAAAFIVLTLALAFLGFVWLKYAAFSSDLTKSKTHVPQPVITALRPVAGAVPGPSVVLVEGVTHRYKHPSGSSILIHLDTAHHLATSLTIPPTARLTAGTTVGRVLKDHGTPGFISEIDSGLKVHVDHVFLLNRTQLRRIVDSLGPLTFDNPSAVVFTVGGKAYELAAGSATLSGSQVSGYVRKSILNPGLTTWNEREQLVLRALTEKLIDIRSLSAVEHLGTVVASEVATDLSASQVVSLVSMRLVTSRIAECTVPARGLLSSDQNKSTVAFFRGTNVKSVGKSGSGCSLRTVSTPLSGTLTRGVRLVARHFSTVLETLLIVVAALWAATGLMLLASTRSVRSFRRRRRRFPRLETALAGEAGALPPPLRVLRVDSPKPPRPRKDDVVEAPRKRVSRKKTAPPKAAEPGAAAAPAPNAAEATPAEPLADPHESTPAPEPRDRAPTAEEPPGGPDGTTAAAPCPPEPPPAEPDATWGSVAPIAAPALTTQAPGTTRPAPEQPAIPGTDPPSQKRPEATTPRAAARPGPSTAAPTDAPMPTAKSTLQRPAPPARRAERGPRLRARLHCATHGHDVRPHRPLRDAEVVYRCIHCGEVVPGPG